jgi:hypothetical protein
MIRAWLGGPDPNDGAENREGLSYISVLGNFVWKTFPYQDFAIAATIFANASASRMSITSAGECE